MFACSKHIRSVFLKPSCFALGLCFCFSLRVNLLDVGHTDLALWLCSCCPLQPLCLLNSSSFREIDSHRNLVYRRAWKHIKNINVKQHHTPLHQRLLRIMRPRVPPFSPLHRLDFHQAHLMSSYIMLQSAIKIWFSRAGSQVPWQPYIFPQRLEEIAAHGQFPVFYRSSERENGRRGSVKFALKSLFFCFWSSFFFFSLRKLKGRKQKQRWWSCNADIITETDGNLFDISVLVHLFVWEKRSPRTPGDLMQEGFLKFKIRDFHQNFAGWPF